MSTAALARAVATARAIFVRFDRDIDSLPEYFDRSRQGDPTRVWRESITVSRGFQAQMASTGVLFPRNSRRLRGQRDLEPTVSDFMMHKCNAARQSRAVRKSAAAGPWRSGRND